MINESKNVYKEGNSVAYLNFTNNTIFTNVMQPSAFYIINKIFDYKKYVNPNVLDLACGDGNNTNKFREYTKGTIIGADISSDMINSCLEQQKVNKIDNEIIFTVCDCLQNLYLFEKYEIKFSIISAFFLLNYTENEIILTNSLKDIYNLLTKDGIFIGFVNAIHGYLPTLKIFKKYGVGCFNSDNDEERELFREGELARFVMFEGEYNKNGPFIFDMTATRFYSKEFLTKCFNNAQFDVEFESFISIGDDEDLNEVSRRSGTIFIANKKFS